MSKVSCLCVFTVHGTHVPRLSKQLSDGTKVPKAAEKHRDGDRETRAPLPYITTKTTLHCSKTYLWLSLDKAACGVAGQKEPTLSSDLMEVAIQPYECCINSQLWKHDQLRNLLMHVLQMLQLTIHKSLIKIFFPNQVLNPCVVQACPTHSSH